MGIFDKVRVPLAFERKNKFSMTPITTCSQDWFSLRPVFSVELPPNSDIRVAHSYYARLSPLQKPILGSGRVVNRAFFVPYRTIMPGFDDFISDTDYTNTYPAQRWSHVPYCKQSIIIDAMISASCVETVSSASDPYDFALPTGSGYVYRKFNEKGRQIYSILTGLGYSLNFGAGRGTDGTAGGDDIEVSLMKLFAYFRIVADWYVNNEFYGRARDIIQNILYMSRGLSPSTDAFKNTLASLFSLTYYSNVDNDYFSTASVRPVTPTGSSSVTITDITNDSTGTDTGSFVRSSTNSSSYLPSTPSAVVSDSPTGSAGIGQRNLTQYVVDALASLTSYMQRNNIVGHKTLDRFKSRFGVTLSADKLDRSYYLGSNQSPIGVDEVMSNADTDGAALGAYAGRGSAGDKNQVFKYNNDSNSFGCFIILSTVLPDIHYGQGISRDNLHINRLDFLTPEMDALGFQAVARAELWNDAKTVQQYQDAIAFKAGDSFGLQPTYSEYCRIPDILAGDFRRIGALDLRAFHLYRMFSESGVEGTPNIKDYKTISENFVVGNPTEFNKIFNYTGTEWDHFYFVHSFHVSLVMPKKRLVDTYEFHDDNEGRPVSMPYRGTKLN